MTAAAVELRTARFTKWRPKKWEAMHEQIVLLSTLGRSNKQIAEMFGYTAQHISNILNTDEAKIVRRRVLDNLRETVKSNIDEALDDLADQAIIRTKQLMFDDDLYEKSPFAVVDRGLSILRGVGRLKTGDGATNNFRGAIILSPDDARILQEGAKRADEAKRLNPVEVPVGPAAAD